MELSRKDCEILPGKRGFLTATVVGEDGAELYLHSLYDPFREAQSHVPTCVEEATLVFLGSGLGYHIPLTLAANPGVKRLVLVERYPELAAAAAAGITDTAVRVEIVTGLSDLPPAETLPPDLDSAFLRIVPHPPSLRANPAWYAGYHAAVATAGRERRRSEPAGGKALTILFLYGGYYGQRECIRGLQALGHRVISVDYRNDEVGTISVLQNSLVRERPDLLFSVNMRGLDHRGVVGEMMVRTGIPLAVWFVDSPEFILSGGTLPPPAATTFFLWDQSYLPQVEALGYRSFSLPLAADPTLVEAAQPVAGFRSRISFVGNSLVSDFLARLAEKFPHTVATRELMAAGVGAILAQRGNQLAALEKVIAGSGIPFSREELLFFRAYAVHSATTRYRTMLLERLLPHGLTFFGDPPGWRAIFGEGIDARADVHYFAETPAVYASSELNFNATSLQMPQAVNQRVFDVPLCGGFLLTDRQEALWELFRDDEVAQYEGVDDLAEKALYYLARPAVREKITAKARRRVLAEHTYERRMGELLRLLNSPGT